jgi:hypothetical protein
LNAPATPNVVNQSWLDNRAAEDSPRPFFCFEKRGEREEKTGAAEGVLLT